MTIQARIVFWIALVLLMVGIVWRVHVKADRAGYERAQAEYAAQTQALANKLQQEKDDAIKQANARAQSNRNAAGNARTELDRLRHTLATGAGNSCTSATERADTSRELFGQCAESLADLAAKADRHASDALMLIEAWPTE